MPGWVAIFPTHSKQYINSSKLYAILNTTFSEKEESDLHLQRIGSYISFGLQVTVFWFQFVMLQQLSVYMVDYFWFDSPTDASL